MGAIKDEARETGARSMGIYLTGNRQPLRVFEQGSVMTRARF